MNLKKTFKVAKKYPYEELGEFDTATECAKTLGVSIKSVCRWLKGEVVSKDYIITILEQK